MHRRFLRYFNSPFRPVALAGRRVAVAVALLLPVLLPAQVQNPVRTVVIDAGHGGHDPGALGKKVKEKNINLAIALKLGGLIRKNCRDVRVIYTRDRDVFVELYRRAQIANENKADLFISIHCNATKNPAMKGPETYVMGLHKSQANLAIAKLENASILLESDYQATYNGFDPNADESYIVFTLYQNSNLDQSTDLAAAIQAQMAGNPEGGTRGVRQAGFMVLYKTTMPSVLVEAGYISNPEEEQYLMSDKGQEEVAHSVFKAFSAFRESLGSTETASKPDAQPADTGSTALSGLVFKVQVAASAVPLDNRNPRLSQFKSFGMYQHNGMYKYTVGNETTLAKCNRLLEEVKNKGLKDAFIVIFRDGKRIPEPEAKRILGK